MALAQANDNRPRILSVVWFKVLPPVFGGQKAVAYFNRGLSAHANLVCLCSRNNEGTREPYRVQAILPVRKAAVFSPFAWRTIYRAARRERSTHLLLEFPYFGLAAILCKRLLRLKLVVNTHNIEYLRFREQGKWWWPLLYRLEKTTLRHADAVFFKTQADLENAARLFGLRPETLSVIPYGVQERPAPDQETKDLLRLKHGISPGEKLLLFAGTLDYAPNAAAVVGLVEKLIPLLEKEAFAYTIIVCGRNRFPEFVYLNKLATPRLLMAGEVADLEPYFAAADVFINPVLQGGGVQTKSMDALARHLNVVGFASKQRGINATGKKLFAVEDGNWPAFAKAIVAALNSNTSTPPAFFETYNWRTIAATAIQKISAC